MKKYISSMQYRIASCGQEITEFLLVSSCSVCSPPGPAHIRDARLGSMCVDAGSAYSYRTPLHPEPRNCGDAPELWRGRTPVSPGGVDDSPSRAPSPRGKQKPPENECFKPPPKPARSEPISCIKVGMQSPCPLPSPACAYGPVRTGPLNVS